MEFVRARNYTRTEGRAIDLIVLHTMEYPERPTGAEWCAAYFAGPSAPQASAHYMIDNNSVVQGVEDKDVAWAAPGANHNGIQLEHAGYAAQGAAGWDDTYSRAMLDLSARLSAKLCKRHNIPVRFVDVAGLKAGRRGITTHAAVSLAFRRSDHTDPGPAFPINEYIAAVKTVLEPPKEEIVQEWVPRFIHWYLFDRPNGVAKPDDIPEGPYSDRIWAVIDIAARYRAEKPADDSALNAALAKISAAKAALS